MAGRYEDINTFVNNNDLYNQLLTERNVKKINQFPTQNLSYPTEDQRAQLNIIRYAWKSTDKFWRLSEKYYNDPSYWWVIAFYNKKPTELDVQSGDLLFIPTPLDQILFFIKGR